MQNHDLYFLHGLDSSGNGTKGRFLKNIFANLKAPDFSGTLKERMRSLRSYCKESHQLTLIGSSYGGLMAALYAIEVPTQVKKLILLAPALNYENFTPPAEKITVPTFLLIGKFDTVTPPEKVLPLAEKSFSDLTIETVDDDHMLHNSFQYLDWNTLITD